MTKQQLIEIIRNREPDCMGCCAAAQCVMQGEMLELVAELDEPAGDCEAIAQFDNNGKMTYQCSECKRGLGLIHGKFCKWCGSRIKRAD